MNFIVFYRGWATWMLMKIVLSPSLKSLSRLLAFLLFDEVKMGRKVRSSANNSKRKGEHTYRGSILKTSQDISSSMLLSEKDTFKKILICHHEKGRDCEEDLAPDLSTVLMKTPISQKVTILE
ncbi:hypothetical protein Lal_00023568 [Lupinus albus]|nr:hypothetical protein Lal_00023568 [Lupinus albus]